MLVLLPAVEKLILFHIGHLTDDLVTTAQMRAQIRASTSTTEPRLQPRYEIYKEFVLHFIQRFQQRASVAAGSVGSNIFRNRIYHVASDDPFYTYAECVTLFCFFDAYVQLLALEDNCELYGLVPDNDEIRARSHGYVVKIFDNYVADDNYDEEQMIAAGPSYYRPEVTDRNYIELLQAGVAQKAFVLQFLLRLGSEKVAVYADRAARIKKSGRAAIITTGINDYKRYHELGMGGFS
jgi:hypothetical protein